MSRTASRPCALILAAGQGKRMRSRVVKLLHAVGGSPTVAHVVRTARAVPCRRIVAVLGVQRDEVRAAIEAASPKQRVDFCVQAEQRGT
ncbi:MAG: NTP transferase domain-containing protein, partial [Acidobacteria bacterium]|nr:NTP transferase domain-containing protein [Acidobacteriota bacterium]